MRPLLDRFPTLGANCPVLPIGSFPTPTHTLDGLCRYLNRSNLYIKRDDLSGHPYGGNKIRKLEFILADAKACGATRIVTSGAAGSNHALATALYGRQYGFKVTLMLFEQLWNPAIAATLLADYSTGAEMYFDMLYADHIRNIATIIDKYEHDEGRKPYLIPAGGSSAAGVMGYVNAGFELKEQIDAGILPEPYAIYCAFGTMGTAAGLLLGIRAAGIQSKIIAVRVVPPVVANLEKFLSLYNASNLRLIAMDTAFPDCKPSSGDIVIAEDYFGEGYGDSTPEAVTAIELLKKTDSIILDPVYTGKTAAAFLADAVRPELLDKPLLFLHTKSSCFPHNFTEKVDYHQLPLPFHRYFTDQG